MEIGKPQRVQIIEPIEDPMPDPKPAPVPDPDPEPDPVPVGLDDPYEILPGFAAR